MKRLIFLVCAILLTALLVGCSKSSIQDSSEVNSSAESGQKMVTVEKTEVEFKSLENVFGFADESGKRLITIPVENGDKIYGPEEFNVAVGNNGELAEIRFVGRQDANDMDNGRQNMYNFDNMAGYIYEVTDGSLNKDKSYLLTKDTILNKNSLVELKPAKDTESDTEYYKKADADTIKRIESIKDRKIIENDLISETAEGEKICLFVFERVEDDMLASIAYIKGDEVVFMDYPAKYDEMSTWRVDAGDRPGLFEVLFLANSDEGLLLGLTWAAPEGEGVFVLKEENGVFQETGLKGGRYCAPM